MRPVSGTGEGSREQMSVVAVQQALRPDARCSPVNGCTGVSTQGQIRGENVMHAIAIAPGCRNRFHSRALMTDSDCTPVRPANSMCAAYQTALEETVSLLCQCVAVDSAMEFRLHKEQGGFMDDKEISEVNRQSGSIRKMEQILSILRTRDDEAFYGFLQWLLDSGHSVWGQALAHRAGLKSTIVVEQTSGHLEPASIKSRPVARVAPLPVAAASHEPPYVGRPVRRAARLCRTLCQRSVQLAIHATVFSGGLAGGCVAGLAIGSMLPIANACLGGYWVGAVVGGLSGSNLGQWAGRKVFSLLDCQDDAE